MSQPQKFGQEDEERVSEYMRVACVCEDRYSSDSFVASGELMSVILEQVAYT